MTAVDLQGRLYARSSTLTDVTDIGRGIESLTAELRTSGTRTSVDETIACSSAGGGLRVAVVGLEPRLTLEAARRTAATAGARIVAAYAGRLDGEASRALAAPSPDVILLTGGTNGGDQDAVVANAARLSDIAPGIPVVFAGNETAREAVRGVLAGTRKVCFARNVLPRIGRLDVDDAQAKIREIFIDHVIGHGRLASPSPLAHSIRMPTPAALLEATRALADLGRRALRLRRPVVIDVGGATTDVHSSLPHDDHERTFGRDAVPDQQLARTVEGDLGLRENAVSLVEEARLTNHVDACEERTLLSEAELRAADRGFVPSARGERAVDERLATLASAIALARHAGFLRVALSDSGAALRKTGRDLRAATCLIATGGVFEHSADASALVEQAAAMARERGALVPDAAPILVDRSYVLFAVGLLSATRPALARRLLVRELDGEGPDE
jgi:uncharacterized protein (TIGR01319 family)